MPAIEEKENQRILSEMVGCFYRRQKTAPVRRIELQKDYFWKVHREERGHSRPWELGGITCHYFGDTESMMLTRFEWKNDNSCDLKDNVPVLQDFTMFSIFKDFYSFHVC